MRGSPLARALLAFLILLLMGVPLWRLTRSEAAPAGVAAAPKVQAPQKLLMQLSFTEEPESVSISHLGREVLALKGSETGGEHSLELPLPAEGLELVFDIHWPTEKLAAMRVVLTDPEGREYDRSLWGRGHAREALAFP